jgi:hypothetical protein
MSDELTRPEKFTARGQGLTQREQVVADGGCCYCTRRAAIFATVGRRAVCGMQPPKAFPACVSQQRGFEFDEEAYREAVGEKADAPEQ